MAFDLTTFRTLYPAFEFDTDAVILAVSEQALCFITDSGCDCGQTGWQLMTAHLLQIRANATDGTGTGVVTSASIDKVSVSLQAPPFGSSSYKFWLAGTPYGQQLAALLARCSAGGVYVGGRPERAAFRSVGGTFPGRGRLF